MSTMKLHRTWTDWLVVVVVPGLWIALGLAIWQWSLEPDRELPFKLF